MEFRKDINGLRAIAVLSVLCYHFGLPGFTGGFVGVDVFFVISGFLMTGIIVTGLEKGDFSVWSFYAARVRRIVPALMALCITLLVLGWFWLSPADYTAFGKHAANALIFNSNFKFKREAGYFDSFSQDKWLLHTWSLSLEWQFYLLLPILLLVLWRWRSRRVLYVALGLLAALSLAVSIIATPSHAAFSFFLLPARAWELLAGSLAFIAARRWPPFIGGYLLSKRRDSECPDFTAAAMAAIDTLPPAVPLIVITRLSYYIHGYNEHPDKKVELRYLDVPDSEVRAAPEDVFIRKTVETMCRMTASGRPVYVLQPLPEIGVEVARTLSRQLMFGKPLRDISIPLEDYNNRHRTALTALRQAEKDCGIRLLDPVPYLCSNGACHGSQDGIPYYYDDDHLSVAGARKLAPLFQQVFEPL